MYRKILVAYDGSAASKKAFDTACQLAEQNHAELFVVSVARPPDIADDVETEAVIENSRQFHARLLSDLQGKPGVKKLKAHFHVVTGHPAEQIIYEADRHGVDLIVVGDRGRSKFVRLLLGSTSKQVTEYAGRPVLVVR